MGSMKLIALRDQAVEILRERLITLEYRPGQIINQERVSADLGISRTPVAQALDRLALDGMVEVIPRTGVMVKPLSAGDAMNLSEVRMSLEPMCARLACERGTDAEIGRIVEIAREGDELSAHEPRKFMVHDRAFHQAIARATHNPVFGETLRRLHDQFLRFCFLSAVDEGQATRMHVEHGDIGDAIAARDADRAEAAMRTHIVALREQVPKTL
jgi:DNA-binding GntR family transcriptional regulator